jgi:hypothetical protein
MYPVYFFIGYLMLFLLVPVIWASQGAWRRAQKRQIVACPQCRTQEVVTFDPVIAVRRHLAGEDRELILSTCTAWPEHRGCDQACVTR